MFVVIYVTEFPWSLKYFMILSSAWTLISAIESNSGTLIQKKFSSWRNPQKAASNLAFDFSETAAIGTQKLKVWHSLELTCSIFLKVVLLKVYCPNFS